MGSRMISKHIYFSIISLLLISIIYLTSVQAENFYADISIDVDSSGFVTIDGITNHPDLLVKNSEIYTSKKQSYWLLNITKEDVFSDFIYILTFPEKSSINYIKSSGFISIEDDKGNLLIKGFGENAFPDLRIVVLGVYHDGTADIPLKKQKVGRKAQKKETWKRGQK